MKMGLKSINLYHVSFETFLLAAREKAPHYEYDFQKHAVILKDHNYDPLGMIRLPLHLAIDHDLSILDCEQLVLYLSITSGNAAICVMEGKYNIYHTTISAYMSRKKQGFSQIKYLNKKGKSRAGSRVRLAATIEFFENINIMLAELFEEYDFHRIAINCSTSLIPYVHQSKETCPFDKRDARLYKIPLHLPQSNYTNLDGAIKKLMAPMLFYDEEKEQSMKEIIDACTYIK